MGRRPSGRRAGRRYQCMMCGRRVVVAVAVAARVLVVVEAAAARMVVLLVGLVVVAKVAAAAEAKGPQRSGTYQPQGASLSRGHGGRASARAGFRTGMAESGPYSARAGPDAPPAPSAGGRRLVWIREPSRRLVSPAKPSALAGKLLVIL